MWQDDWMMRQLTRFALGVAELIAGGEHASEEDVEDIEQAFGPDLHHLLAMSEQSLSGMFDCHDAQQARRALGVGSLMARHAELLRREGRHEEAERVQRKAARLVGAVVEAAHRPEPEVVALHEALLEQPRPTVH